MKKLSAIPKKFFAIGLAVILFSLLIFTSVFMGSKTAKNTVSSQPTSTPKPTQVISNVSLDEALTTKGRFPQDLKIATVGEETIYGRDLNYISFTKYYPDFLSNKISLETLKDKILPIAINQSILLQTDKKEQNSDLPRIIFDNPQKDLFERDKAVLEIENRRIDEEEKISGAFISIWFHNVRNPSIPLEEAKSLASSKIQKVYDSIKGGSITFEEGGQMIKNDGELATIDINYKGNAYFEFSDKTLGKNVFVYKVLNDLLWKLSEGEMTEVFQYPDPSIPLGTEEEEFYGIIKVTKRTNPGNGSYADWLKKEKEKYEISVF